MRTLLAAMIAFFTLFSVNAQAASKAKCDKGSYACSSAKKASYKKKSYYKKRAYYKKRYGKKRYAKKRYSKKRYTKKRYAKKRYSKRRYAKKRYAKRRYAKRRYAVSRYSKKRYAKKRYAKKRYAKKRKYAYRSSYKKTRSRRSVAGYSRTGVASYYWQPQAVASGGRFNPNALTAAHKSLPFGTLVRVTHLGNGRSVTVRINDRGPYIKGRIIDLSRRAAGVIRMRGQGIARVKIQIVGRSKKRRG